MLINNINYKEAIKWKTIMGDVAISDMIIASLLKIWHIIPIVLLIILFKVFMKKKDNNRRRKQNEENEKNGLTLLLRTQKKYENLGYEVKHYEKQNNEQEQDISLVCERDEKTLLIHCKEASLAKSIHDKDIKKFYTKANDYLQNNKLIQKDVEFRYVIPYSDVLSKSAIKILNNESYNCKYAVV